MYRKSIDYEKCTSCMACAKICANSRVIGANAQGKPVFLYDYKCISCGHCLAICPEGAISFTLLPADQKAESGYFAQAKPIADGNRLPDAVSLYNLLCATRTTRFFLDKPVEKEKIDTILEVMVRAPSAGNEQNRHFRILTDPVKIAALEEQTKAYYQKTLLAYKNPLLSRLIAYSLARKTFREKSGQPDSLTDRKMTVQSLYRFYLKLFRQELAGDNAAISYLRQARTVIVITSTRKTGMHTAFYKGDVTIAATYGTLMAKALGLSTCWLGLLEMAVNKSRPLRDLLNLSANERVDAGLALGYSDLAWQQIPPRGPVKVIWYNQKGSLKT